jgi:hypothetical protein
MVRKFVLTLFLGVLGFSGIQAQKLVAYVSLNKSDAYIGEPVSMTVSVHTSTWFTEGVDLGNLQVDNALTVYFRSVSNRKQIGGKAMPGVDFLYNLYPTKAGTLTIPEIKIHVSSPPEGGYEGKPHVLTTQAKSIQVRDVPLGFSADDWLVTTNLTVSENWSAPLDSVNVGEVLERTISRRASGTLAEFIPSIRWDSIAGVSIYPKRPKVDTHRGKTAVSASQSQTASYLFEKEGYVTLPATSFTYWSPYTKKTVRKTLDSVRIKVVPNPDLGMLETAKKNLEASQVTEVPEDEPLTILGLTPKEFALWASLGLLALYILYRINRWAYYGYKKQRKALLASEVYAFKQLKKALTKKESKAFYTARQHWLSKTQAADSLSSFIKAFGSAEDQEKYLAFDKALFEASTNPTDGQWKDLGLSLTQARKTWLAQQTQPAVADSGWLNPLH